MYRSWQLKGCMCTSSSLRFLSTSREKKKTREQARPEFGEVFWWGSLGKSVHLTPLQLAPIFRFFRKIVLIRTKRAVQTAIGLGQSQLSQQSPQLNRPSL
jgi:hypothetical protein